MGGVGRGWRRQKPRPMLPRQLGPRAAAAAATPRYRPADKKVRVSQLFEGWFG
eukprot:COSAG04_NODE_27062_length_287_cov_0.819149_1_plen_52_part_01